MQWWKDGLLVRIRVSPEGLVLALVYAVTCWGARKLSLDQFFLPAGVRVASLLLCPPRLWPYLLIGVDQHTGSHSIVTADHLVWNTVCQHQMVQRC